MVRGNNAIAPQGGGDMWDPSAFSLMTAIAGHSQTNLALNQSVTASTSCSGCGGNYSPSQAVDGNLGTDWIASSGAFPQWLVVDLGSSSDLTSVSVVFYASDTWYYKIDGSNDDATWTTLVDHTASGATGQTLTDGISGIYRFVRIYITNAGSNWAAIWELQVNGYPNLAQNKSAGSSSFCNGCGGNYAAPQAVDGNSNSDWIAANGTFPQWLVVDLGALTTLSSVDVQFYTSDTWYYKVEASNDNSFYDSTWTTLVDHTASGVAGQSIEDNVSGTFRYVRVYITNSGGNWAAIWEFQVFGSAFSQPRNIVSSPNLLSTGSYLIGAQACNLWDSAYFWTTVATVPSSRPLLGYYDESYDVSTDWAINMMVDHGINFVMPCWYRMLNNDGQSPVMASYDQFTNSIANSAQYRTRPEVGHRLDQRPGRNSRRSE